MHDRCTATRAVPASSAGAGTSSAMASPRRIRTCFIVDPRICRWRALSSTAEDAEDAEVQSRPGQDFSSCPPCWKNALCALRALRAGGGAAALDVVVTVFAAVVLR